MFIIERKKTMEEKKNQKLSYAELEKVAENQYKEIAALRQAVERNQIAAAFRRLDYLFRVMELKGCFDDEFVKGCADEIVRAMTIPAEEDERQDN